MPHDLAELLTLLEPVTEDEFKDAVYIAEAVVAWAEAQLQLTE